MSESARPITLLIAALGGEGGGLLSKWVVELAEAGGYLVQYTSIPGVAQRTGATTYYIEMFPATATDRPPVMALTPGPGDVDILLASEIVEAGRMIERGFVTPDRSSLICSTHRIYAIAEKGAMADGRIDTGGILRAGGEMSHRFIHFDMAALARQSGSAINAVLFGALAGSGALPFARPRFEEAITAGAVAVGSNMAGFAAGFEAATGARKADPAPSPVSGEAPPHPLFQRIERDFAPPLHDTLRRGVARLIDYQDDAYAALYLDRLDALRRLDDGATLLGESARYLALWMSYEDGIRIADLKTRAARFARFRDETAAGPGDIVRIVEFIRPGVEEFCAMLPPGLARMILRSEFLARQINRFSRGRHVRTTSAGGFLLFWLLARLRRFRRRLYGFHEEQGRIKAWLRRIEGCARSNPHLATEIARCGRLIKGYGETRARGFGNLLKIVMALPAIEQRDDAPALVAGLRQAALADEDGAALAGALAELPAADAQQAAK